MNEPNSLENQLRSWTPRRASDEVAAKIFARETQKTHPAFSLNPNSDVASGVSPAVEGLASRRPENGQPKISAGLKFLNRFQFVRFLRRAGRHGFTSGETPDATFAHNSTSEFGLNWLAPATVGILSLFVICGAHPHWSSRADEPDTNLFFASITMDNVTSFTSASSLNTAFNLRKRDMNLEQNVWRTASFEWTNLPQSHSSIRSLPVEATNSLTR